MLSSHQIIALLPVVDRIVSAAFLVANVVVSICVLRTPSSAPNDKDQETVETLRSLLAILVISGIVRIAVGDRIPMLMSGMLSLLQVALVILLLQTRERWPLTVQVIAMVQAVYLAIVGLLFVGIAIWLRSDPGRG